MSIMIYCNIHPFADNDERGTGLKAKGHYIEISGNPLTYPDDFGCLDHRNAPLIQEKPRLRA